MPSSRFARARRDIPAVEPLAAYVAAGGRVAANEVAALIKLAVAAVCVLVAALVWGGYSVAPRLGGKYILRNSDHQDAMVAQPSHAARTIRVLFVGNSYIFTNDLPAMLTNVAASDPGNSTALEVEAETHIGADLAYMFAHADALRRARSHHFDYVVLQEHSGWYETQRGYAMTLSDIERWRRALEPLHETPVLFELWADDDGSARYTYRDFAMFGKTPAEDSRDAAESTGRLARQLGLKVVSVGEAFERARNTRGAPDVLGPDRQHPSIGGTYLAALVFYRFLTGRDGSQAAYRPWTMERETAAVLARIAAE